MKTLVKQLCTLGICSIIFTQYSCREKYVYRETDVQHTDSVLRLQSDSIARAAAAKPAVDSASRQSDAALVYDVTLDEARLLDLLRAGQDDHGDNRVIAMAKKMTPDQEKVYAQLNDYASRKGIKLSTDTLVDMSFTNEYGTRQWDSAWVSMTGAGYDVTLSRMQMASKISDPELQGILTAAQPLLQQQQSTVHNLGLRAR